MKIATQEAINQSIAHVRWRWLAQEGKCAGPKAHQGQQDPVQSVGRAHRDVAAAGHHNVDDQGADDEAALKQGPEQATVASPGQCPRVPAARAMGCRGGGENINSYRVTLSRHKPRQCLAASPRLVCVPTCLSMSTRTRRHLSPHAQYTEREPYLVSKMPWEVHSSAAPKPFRADATNRKGRRTWMKDPMNTLPKGGTRTSTPPPPTHRDPHAQEKVRGLLTAHAPNNHRRAASIAAGGKGQGPTAKQRALPYQ
jgi:hypothetical protein